MSEFITFSSNLSANEAFKSVRGFGQPKFSNRKPVGNAALLFELTEKQLRVCESITMSMYFSIHLK